MTIVSSIFKEKKFPDWFTSHPIFKDVTNIKKVFPGIGLPNSEEEIEIDNVAPAREAAKNITKVIDRKISDRIKKLQEYITSKPTMGAARKTQGDLCITLLSAMNLLMQKDRAAFVQTNNGKFTIKLPENILIEGQVRPVFRGGESLFRVYNKLNEALRAGQFAAMVKLENLEEFKSFSTNNVPNNKYRIVFSSDNADGAWDIGTMSMRGIKSCQSWSDGEYKHCTIGSVIDPFVGIMYLTSGAKSAGSSSKMMKRSIVRFVINGKTNKPYILVDYMYPVYDSKVFTQFSKFIKEKSGLEAKYAPLMDQDMLRSTYIPLTDLRKKLKETSRDGKSNIGYDLESIQSYQDVKILDKVSNKNDKQAALYDKNIKKKINKFTKDLQDAFVVAIKTVDIADFSDQLKPLIRKFRGDDKHNFNCMNYAPEIAKSLSDKFVKSIDKDQFTSSNLFIQRVYCSYFNNKSKVFEDLKEKLPNKINGRLGLKKDNKLKADNFVSMMKSLTPKIDEAMKIKLKEFIANKPSTVLPLPLP